jgi:histone deacetylase complex regulatory component SIN3
MRKSRMMFGIFALSLASTSCLRQAKTQQVRVFTPPPTRPVPTVSDTVPQLPEAPPISTDEAAVIPPPLPGVTPETLPEVPEAPKRVTRRVAPPVVAPKPPAAAQPESPAPPRLAQMFTPEELRENTKVLDDSLERVNQALAKVEGRNLTPEQKEIAERIRTFRKQAEQVREQDLLTAVSLAKRADLLAKDLLEHLP